jgi:DNA helicase II / ATP-dependent DNA helicase PcrA
VAGFCSRDDGVGTTRSSTCSTTIPARAAATSTSWSAWQRSIQHGRASSPTSHSILRKRVAAKPACPLKDEDWLVLSTIHSAKGQEWRAVFVLNVVDGCIPSDLATGTADEIDEERRLLYVAMTRARDDLVLMQPMRFFIRGQARGGNAHVLAPRSRFIAEADLDAFELVRDRPYHGTGEVIAGTPPTASVDLKAQVRAMWR